MNVKPDTGAEVTGYAMTRDDPQPRDRTEIKERIQLAIDWLTAIDLLWSWGDRRNPVVQYANEILEIAKVTQLIESLEPDDDIVLSHVDELERCVALTLAEASEWGEIWVNPRR